MQGWKSYYWLLAYTLCGTCAAEKTSEGLVEIERAEVAITVNINSCSGVQVHITPPQLSPSFSSPDMHLHRAVPPDTIGKPMTRSLLTDDSHSSDTPSWWRRMRNTVDEVVPQWRITITERTEPIRTYIKNNWMSLTSKAFVTGYIYVNYVMFRLVTFLQSPDRWFYWKHDISLGKFMTTPARELIAEMIVVGRLRQDKKQPVLLTVLAELEIERASLERYRSWVSRIYAVDDAQQQCAHLCEKCMPSMVSFPVGCVLRTLVSYLGARRVIYCNDSLMKSSTEYLAKIEYLKEIVVEALNSHIA